ncbi:MAG: TQO small subunit DoxD [Brumimicrobium sp.]
MNNLKNNTQDFISTNFTLVLRLVVGWTYFSAFWRRVALSNKLDPDAVGYIGEKFNHFLPNALGIKPIIEYLVTHPEALWWNMVIFTVIEGIVGLLIMFGFFTRLMSIGVFFLALGILLGSGWIGTTCLDEWQIGVLGIAVGFTLFLSGGGAFSLDYYFHKKKSKLFHRINPKLTSGDLKIKRSKLSKINIVGAFAILFITLFTNQYFHGGVWGDLHNKSVKPKLEITNAVQADDKIEFDLYRVEGVDVYGSFLIGVEVLNAKDEKVYALKGEDLAQFNVAAIDNEYVAKIKPGAHSLVIPLGAKARMTLQDEVFSIHDQLKLVLTDISGAVWEVAIKD